ncbi:hypothetical protein EU537_02310 [Candidatus Thorarchaeota archaeon]|nr:MAG: hypothetical protein EU537_02310 [Candidatus Thorarchaeota archaeon]
MLSIKEVAQKCRDEDFSVICVDAYKALKHGNEGIENESTDAFPWLSEAAEYFLTLAEYDNAINSLTKAIDLAISFNLIGKAYSFFTKARNIYETGINEGANSVSDAEKTRLKASGLNIIEAAKTSEEVNALADMQAELKASILGGVSLKKAEKDENKGIVISHGDALYKKKSKEYKESTQKFIDSGIPKSAVVFACMGALADLMLNKPKEGLAYLTEIAEKNRQAFQYHPCFEWTKLIFRIAIQNDKESIVRARKEFLQIPFSYRDDREFARRVMESVAARIN